MPATNEQVQNFVDQEVRPISEMIRGLKVRCEDAQARIDDVFANLVPGPSSWTDTREDSPPHLLTPNDVLSWNAFVANLVAAINGSPLNGQTAQERLDAISGNYSTIVDACVRSIGA